MQVCVCLGVRQVELVGLKRGLFVVSAPPAHQLVRCSQGHSLSFVEGLKLHSVHKFNGTNIEAEIMVDSPCSLSDIAGGDLTRHRCTPAQGRPDLCSNICVPAGHIL